MNRTLETVSLHEIMAVRAGTVDPSRHPDEVFELYSIPAFDNGVPDVLAGSEIGSSKQVVEPGDVLLSKIVPHIRRAWVVGPKNGSRIIASSEWIVFRSERFVPEYLRHVLMGDPFHAQFMKTVSGVGGSLLRARPAHVAAIKIPLPSRTEQRRIAGILDEADALRRKRAEAIRLVDTLSTALFIDQVGDPIRNPKGWRMSTFGDELADLEYGPRFYNESYTPDGVRIVRITDLDAAGNLDFDSMPRLEVEPEVKAARCLKPGDIILARSGATVGKSALIKEGAPECIAGAYFIRLQFKKSVRPQYVKMLLDTKPIQTIIAQRSVQSAQQNFSGPGIRALPLLVPPDEVQRGVEAAMAERAAILEKMMSSRIELENLFHSLLQRAFRGEL